MTQYKLTNKAVEDLSKFWDYTSEVWLEIQADKYYDGLISSCQEIAENPYLAKNYEGISAQIFGMKANRQIIFYRTESKNHIKIARILHERMDLKKRITE
jgi:toxin ParE1/3/4